MFVYECMYNLKFWQFERNPIEDESLYIRGIFSIDCLHLWKRFAKNSIIFNWSMVEGRRNFKRKGRKWELTNIIRGVNIIVHKIYLIYRPPNNSPLSTYPCFFLVPTFVPRSTTRNQPSNTIESKEKRNENPRFTFSSPRGSINSNESRNGNRRGRIDRGELRFGRTVGP